MTQSDLEGSRLAERIFLHDGVETTQYRRDSRFSSKYSNVEITLQIKKPKTDVEPDFENEEHDTSDENCPEITKAYNLVYINDLEGLFELFGMEHVPKQWRLFLDGSSNSLKVVLLYNENTLPSIPLAYCRKLPEKYESMKSILSFIKYHQYMWEVIVDFKLINILLGLM